MSTDGEVLRASRAMATGTVLSRLTGMVREPVVGAVLGTGALADAYGIANTVPNIFYILLVGGVINAVFVPQLVRHMADDSDAGQAYADRLLTAVGGILLAVTVAVVVAAPLIAELYTAACTSERQVEVATILARYCLAQVFFYGVFTMYQQVLNSRGSFVAPMYAPILNNAIVIVVFVIAMVTMESHPTIDSVTDSQLRFLGLGTTAGIVAQALILVPVAAKVGYRFQLRRDLRGQGLGKAFVLAKWTILFVLTNQVTYAVIVRLAGQNNACPPEDVSPDQAAANVGFATYQRASLLFMLPHSIITVSIVTALLPGLARAAHAGSLGTVGRDVGRGMRTVAALVTPAAVGFVVMGPAIGRLLYGWGATTPDEASWIGATLQALSVGLLPFTLFYVLLRGFYALEDTRTPFRVNLVLNALNLVFAVVLFVVLTGDDRVPGLGLALALAYLFTLMLTWHILSGRVGDLDTYVTVRTMVRCLIAAGVAYAVAGVGLYAISELVPPGHLADLLTVSVGLTVSSIAYVWLAARMRVPEVDDALEPILRRLHRR